MWGGLEGVLVVSRVLMSHLRGLGGRREQPATEHVAEQAEELLTDRVGQPAPELIVANQGWVLSQRRGGTDRLESSDMARLPIVLLGIADTSVPVPTTPTR